ncbi:MAG: winged helix-turn-helix domain-containing protein [Bacteroidales bacterium]|nr:winged helix-turn-helix domain-containing protein [Bacteroidales bacterium]
MIKNKIGVNAVIIWNVLNNNNGAMTFNQLEQVTQLGEKDLYLALGWLYKENKVYIERDEANFKIYLTDNAGLNILSKLI